MDRQKIAQELVAIARELIAFDVDGLDCAPMSEWTPEEDRENAKRVVQKAMRDSLFKQLFMEVRRKAVYFNNTSSPKSFSFHVPIPLMLNVMQELGWADSKDELARFVSRRIYKNPDSSVSIMKAEGDAFVVTPR